MPGVGIQGFTRKALQMAQAGIYDLRIHHDEILWPLLRHWNLFDLEGLPPQAEQRPGSGWPPTWPRPTDWPAGSRPNGCGPPKPKSARHDLLARESGCSTLAGLARVRVAGVPARGADREVLDADAPQQPKRPGRAGTVDLLASGPDPHAAPRLARAASGWRCRPYGDRLPTAAAGFGAGRLPGRLELVGGLAAQLIKLGHGLLGGAFDLRPLPNRLADSVIS